MTIAFSGSPKRWVKISLPALGPVPFKVWESAHGISRMRVKRSFWGKRNQLSSDCSFSSFKGELFKDL